MHEIIFVKRPKFLSATSSFCVEQNLGHLGRFMHFSQKVVGVILKSSEACVRSPKASKRHPEQREQSLSMTGARVEEIWMGYEISLRIFVGYEMFD